MSIYVSVGDPPSPVGVTAKPLSGSEDLMLIRHQQHSRQVCDVFFLTHSYVYGSKYGQETASSFILHWVMKQCRSEPARTSSEAGLWAPTPFGDKTTQRCWKWIPACRFIGAAPASHRIWVNGTGKLTGRQSTQASPHVHYKAGSWHDNKLISLSRGIEAQRRRPCLCCLSVTVNDPEIPNLPWHQSPWTSSEAIPCCLCLLLNTEAF